LISIDSLRADHLGAYGYAKPTSPTIDALARDGVLFSRSSSTTAWTRPGHMSMLTGRSLLGHGVVSDDRSLTDDVPLLSESFKAAGYTTGAIVSAPYLEARYGFARGFDVYDDKTINFATHGESYKHVTAPLLVETAEKWLNQHASGRFFLFLHFWDVHYDYAPGAPYDTMFDPDYKGSITGDNFYFNPAVNRKMDPRDLAHVLALYDGEIRLVDDHLAKLRGALERHGVAGRTIIVITADHGDEFFEHGRKGHHRTLYDEILRVPMVMYVPGVRPAKAVVDVETSIVDIMPTVLGLTGLPVPAGLDGMDLSGVAVRGDALADRITFGELYRKDALNVQTSLRRTGRKVIHHFNRRIVETYDVAADPGEAKPLVGGGAFGSAMVAQLGDLLNALWPVYQGRITSSGVNDLPMDDETRERLRSLGYVD
jgi:arylsulfatase